MNNPSDTSQATPSRDCDCVRFKKIKVGGHLPTLHGERQDTECEPWKRLLEAIEIAAEEGTEEFVPLREMSMEERVQIVTLPPTIAKLKAVKHLVFYSSGLVRVPPEIGQMSALEKFTPYTSYKLHWFPYEITRCPNLKDSTVSTRALFGNHKYRAPFPDLSAEDNRGALALATPSRCSVCQQPMDPDRVERRWVSLRVATDVLPLLVNACSDVCLAQVPVGADGYVDGVHTGGLQLEQPPPMKRRL